MNEPVQTADVLIIGAGPSGTVAGALLARQGLTSIIIERQSFPRFSIGESLLPQCMHYLEEAGLLDAIAAEGFQLKDGAKFECGAEEALFHFSDKYSPGWATTFEVQRDRFDQILAEETERLGVTIRFRESVESVTLNDNEVTLDVRDEDGQALQYRGRFLLDASGYGRVLPRLLDLERPSGFPVRQSVFTHIEDRITSSKFDRNKVLITIHPEHRDVWYWLIPFSNGRSSIGVVADAAFFETREGSNEEILRNLANEAPGLCEYLKSAHYDRPVQKIVGYSASVTSLYGKSFALLGNAAEFLDPVFSSGVTIAMKSASLAVAALTRQLKGEEVDWEKDFARPLMVGVKTFRTYVEGWYDQSFQDIIFYPTPEPRIKRMICSILAGYAWDETNPYVRESERRVATLAKLCAPRTA